MYYVLYYFKLAYSSKYLLKSKGLSTKSAYIATVGTQSDWTMMAMIILGILFTVFGALRVMKMTATHEEEE